MTYVIKFLKKLWVFLNHLVKLKTKFLLIDIKTVVNYTVDINKNF